MCSLHHYCGTQSDGTGAVVGKALVRILRNAREIQYMVLKVHDICKRISPTSTFSKNF